MNILLTTVVICLLAMGLTCADDSHEMLTTSEPEVEETTGASPELQVDQPPDSQDPQPSDAPSEKPLDRPGEYKPKSCSSSILSLDEKHKCCDDLNSRRANFTACCEYPMLVVLTSQRNECIKKCSESSIPPSSCCVLNCCLKKIRVLNESAERSGVNAEHFAHAFLNSVHNEKKWMYPIMSAVSTCYSALAVDEERLMKDEKLWACEGKVPGYFYELVDCAYERNFLNCPMWNPKNVTECGFARQYVSECLLRPKERKSDENTNVMD